MKYGLGLVYKWTCICYISMCSTQKTPNRFVENVKIYIRLKLNLINRFFVSIKTQI